MTIEFVPLAEEHIPEAIDLVRDEARREQEHVHALPVDDATGPLTDSVSHAVRNGIGVAAISDGQLAGFMALYGPIERFFGTANGAISPLHAHAARGQDRERLYERMLTHVAATLVEQRMTSLAIAAFAHDQAARDAFVLNGFGIRNADAIRDIRTRSDAIAPDGYTFLELADDEVVLVHPLENGLIRHLRSSPTFLPAHEMDEKTFLRDRTGDARFFAAMAGKHAVGYLKVSKAGENVLTTVPRMRSISGAYLKPEHRGQGVYDRLVSFAANTLRDEEIDLLGTDFETINPAARRFWGRAFSTYSWSYVRRVDDGILEDGTS